MTENCTRGGDSERLAWHPRTHLRPFAAIRGLIDEFAAGKKEKIKSLVSAERAVPGLLESA